MKRFLALVLLLTSSFAFGDSLSIYFIKSPYGINWSSPWLMTTSTLVNQLAPSKGRSGHSISHTYAEIKCDSRGVHMFRGMTSISNDEEQDLIFKKQYGLGVIFHTFKGRYEKNEDIQKDIANYWGDKRLSVLNLEISPSTCARLENYMNEYEALGYGLMYSGLQADPLKREGSGCSAYVVSLLRVGGLMQDFTNEWKEVIDVPLKLIGGPMTNKKVSLMKVLLSVRTQWSSKRPHYHLEAWNPDLMHKWLLRTHKQVRNGEYSEFDATIDQFQNTRTLNLDFSHLPTPVGGFWLN